MEGTQHPSKEKRRQKSEKRRGGGDTASIQREVETEEEGWRGHSINPKRSGDRSLRRGGMEGTQHQSKEKQRQKRRDGGDTAPIKRQVRYEQS